MTLDLKTKIMAWELGSLTTITATATSQYGWQGAAIGICIATYAYGSRYLPQISLNFNSQSKNSKKKIPQHATEAIRQAREHFKIKQDVKLKVISNDEKSDWAIGTTISLRSKIIGKNANAPLMFVIGHEMSHIHNDDGSRRGTMIIPAFCAALTFLENITKNGNETISTGLVIASAIYAIAQTLAFFHYSQLVEQRCDMDGLEFCDNLNYHDSFQKIARKFSTHAPEERLKKKISILKRLFSAHPQGWNRFEQMERNHFETNETPISDKIYPELCEEHNYMPDQ